MKFFVPTFVLVVWSLTAFSQKSPMKFGDIPMADMKMTVYDKDSSAAAVVLADYGVAYFDGETAALNFTRHTRIKILTKEGLSWANSSVSHFYYGGKTPSVSGFKAATYNLENGKIVASSVSKENVFREKFNKNVVIEKFTLPDVHEGSVIEYTYTSNGGGFPTWRFQSSIPERWSEFWVYIPEIFQFDKDMRGYIAPTVYDVKPTLISQIKTEGHHFICENVPAFEKEPYMTSDDDYISKVSFELTAVNNHGTLVELITSWDRYTRSLTAGAAFGQIITKGSYLKSKTEELVNGVTDPMQKVRVIYDFVKENISWDGTLDYLADDPKKILEARKGTSGDINLVLASMLQKAGIDVDMILLSTRDHGLIRQDYRSSTQFNYVICSIAIGEKTIFLDATEKYLPMTILPERCFNGQGLIVSTRNSGWVDITPTGKSRSVVNGNFDLSATGDLKGKLSFNRSGYYANKMRSSYHSKGEEAYIKEQVGNNNWTIDKTVFSSLKELDQVVGEEHQLSINEQATVAGDKLYINPLIAFKEGVNPFKSDKREYPVDFGSPFEKIYSVRIVLPAGYLADEVPKSQIFAMPGNAAKYIYNLSQLGNVITLTTNFQINKGLYTMIEYPDLREFYNHVIAKQEEQIVLRKQ